MAISYVGGKGAGTAGQGGGSVDLTTGLSGGSGGAPIAGDLVVVTVSVGTAGRSPTLSISTPSGYTALTAQRTTATSFDTNIQTCYKVMGSTPDTSVTIPASGNVDDGIAYTIQVFRGVAASDPMDVTPTYANQSGVSNIPDPAAITPVSTGAWIVVCGGGACSANAAAYTASYLTNFLYFNGQDTNDALIGSGYYTGWTSGAYDPAAFGGGTVNATFSWGATTLALRPAVSVSTNVTGVSGTGAVGTVTVSGKASTAVTGVSGTGAVGTVVVSIPALVNITGVEGTGQVGDVTVQVGVSIDVTGVEGTGQVGDVSVSQSIAVLVAGVEGTGEIGDVTVSTSGISVLVTGVAATGYVGSVLVWGLVDDTQSPNWQNVVSAGAPVWTPVATPDAGGWVQVTTGSGAWSAVTNTQDAGWTPVNT